MLSTGSGVGRDRRYAWMCSRSSSDTTRSVYSGIWFAGRRMKAVKPRERRRARGDPGAGGAPLTLDPVARVAAVVDVELLAGVRIAGGRLRRLRSRRLFGWRRPPQESGRWRWPWRA